MGERQGIWRYDLLDGHMWQGEEIDRFAIGTARECDLASGNRPELDLGSAQAAGRALSTP